METVIPSIVSFDRTTFPKAAELFDAAHSGKYRVICCGGAIRGGKSYGVGGVLMTLHDRFPGSRSFVVRDSLPTLRDTTLPTMQKLIPQGFVRKFNATHYQWTFTNNSQFQFFAEQDSNDPERKRWNGIEANYIWLEQIEELQRKTWEKAFERVGSYFVPKALGPTPPPIIFVTVNPTDEWVKTEIYDRWVNGTLPPDWLYIPMTITDNGGLEESFVHSLKNLKLVNPVKYKRFVEGDWEVKEKEGGEWHHPFEYGRHDGRVDFVPGEPIHISIDFNVVPYMTLICAQIKRIQLESGQWVEQIGYFKEYTLAHPHNTTEDLCKALIHDYLAPAKRAGKPCPVYFYGDRQGKNRVEGFGDKLRRFDALESALAGYLHKTSDRVNKRVVVNVITRDLINDVLAEKLPYRLLFDEKNCPLLIKDMASVKEGATGGIKKEMSTDRNGVKFEKNGHLLSANTYLVGAILDKFL